VSERRNEFACVGSLRAFRAVSGIRRVVFCCLLATFHYSCKVGVYYIDVGRVRSLGVLIAIYPLIHPSIHPSMHHEALS
jgi:hypothetical protein